METVPRAINLMLAKVASETGEKKERFIAAKQWKPKSLS